MNDKIKLMKNTFYNEDDTKKKLCEFIISSERLSMGDKCLEFENKFSKYQDRKYSVLFNSGSSANLALIQSMMNIGFLKKGDNVGFSALTWATNIMPLIQLGLNPIPIDISLSNLNVNSNNLKTALKKYKLKALFLTNLLGFCGDLDSIYRTCKKEKIILLEDNCESLGSIYKKKRLGNFGLAGTTSFFVGHHLSTIEGGMVFTDIKEIYEQLLMVRSHGWVRNLGDESKNKLNEKYNIDKFYSGYTFYSLGYNLRPTEITGFLGCEQIEYLDKICRIRQKNFNRYEESLKGNKNFLKTNFDNIEFVSNFAYPIICKNKDIFNEYVKKLSKSVEIRPIVGGSIVEQPFFNNKEFKCPNAEKVHKLGFYIPNNPDLDNNEINKMLNLLE